MVELQFNPGQGFLLAGILFFLAAGSVLLWLGARRRRAVGLPPGRIIYDDSGSRIRLEKPLYDPALGLVGKPDYVVKQGLTLIPVELKSGFAPSHPYDSHIFQLAAYCLLLHSLTGNRPSCGILQYRNRTFEVEYTPALEEQLLALLEEVRSQEKRADPDRSHQEPARCARCGYRSLCDRRL